MQIRLLGPVDVVDAAGSPVALGGPKERTVLAVLAIHHDHVVSEERLLDALWGEEPPRTASKTLQAYISRLRRTLDGIRIDTTIGGYTLVVDEATLDVARVEAEVAEARAQADAGDLAGAAATLARAEGAWRAPSLADVAHLPFAVAQAARLDELRAVIAEQRIEALLAGGRHVEIVGELEALTRANPLRERLWTARILALYRAGRQADALRAYSEVRALLVEELGIEPGPELRALEAAILAQDPGLQWESPPASPGQATLPTGVVTFLMTDIEGSTAMWDSSSDAMAAALERHDGLIADAVGSAGGTLLKAKGEGDATLSVFARASAAVVATLRIQRSMAAEPWPGGLDLRVRAALHTGEAHEREGDYFGPTLNRAARLRALAEGGQVLLSSATAELVRDGLPDGASLIALGRRELRGMSRDEDVHELVAATIFGLGGAEARSAPAAPKTEDLAVMPLPAALTAAALLIGREEPLERLDAMWAAAQMGRRVCVLVGGEPGIGKTALAVGFARATHAAGAIVLHGRCDEDLGVPYQPFAEALGSYAAWVAPEVLRAQLATRAPDLGNIVPEVATRLRVFPSRALADPGTERLEAFDAVVTLLSSLTSDRPVVLVVDDLHWAAPPTLLLLRYVVRRMAGSRLMVIGTYRDTEVDSGHPLSAAIADLHREGVELLSLGGLDRMGTEDFLAALAGPGLGDDPAARTAELLSLTSGNPFFLTEVVRHLAESDDREVPRGIRDVVARRLARLSPSTYRALRVAAVVGQRFSAPLLELVPDVDCDVVDAIDEAVAAGLVVESDGGCAFAHALVREVLAADVGAARRTRLHRQVGEALEQLPDAPGRTEALAHHFGEAVLDGCIDRAAEYAHEAALRAITARAPDAAIEAAERGLAALAQDPEPDIWRRASLRVVLAEALSRMNEVVGAADMARLARVDAEATGDAYLQARAAIAVTRTGILGRPEPSAREAVEIALAGLDPGDDVRRAQLLQALASHDTWAAAQGEAAYPLAMEAVAAARQTGDLALVGNALETAHRALLGTTRFDDRRAIATELNELAATTDDPALTRVASRATAQDALCLGDPDALDAAIAASEDSDRWTSITLGIVELLRGSFGNIEARLAAVPDLASEGATNFVAQDLLRGWEMGESDVLIERAGAAAATNPGIPAFAAGINAVLAELGHDVRGSMAELIADDFAAVSRDAAWVGALCLLARASWAMGDTTHAADLRRHLLPFAGTMSLTASAVCFGAVDRHLAALDALLGRPEEAAGHFRAALEIEERLRAAPCLARTKAWYARFLRGRDWPGDAVESRRLATEAAAVASELGMRALADDARAMLRRPLPIQLAPRSTVLVGRGEAMAVLQSAWDDAQRGERRAVLLGGEAGVGKTRLATELAQRAHHDGAVVLYGRCDEGLGTAFQPFAEALRDQVLAIGAAQLEALVGNRIADLAAIVPEVRHVFDLAPSLQTDMVTERLDAFEAVVDVLGAATREAPVVLVIDDLHWAAQPTLLLLRYLLRRQLSARLLVIGTFRDDEIDRDHPLTATLAELNREFGVERLPVRGLDEADVADYVASLAGHALDGDARRVVAELHETSSGNPFLVAELLRHLVDSGALVQVDGTWHATKGVADLGIPDTVREVLSRRVERLSTEAQHALTVAAVAGSRFSMAVLERVPEAGDPGGLLDAIDEALAAGVVIEEGRDLAFVHALVRQSLLEGVTSLRRARYHRRIGEALEGLPDAPGRIEALAHHFLAAVADGQASKAVAYAHAAANHAASRLAFEEAAAWAEQALELLDVVEVDPSVRCELRCVLAESCWRSGDWSRSWVAAEAAAADARQHGLVEWLTRATVLYCEQVVLGNPDTVADELCAEALRMCDAADLATRARLLAAQARMAAWTRAEVEQSIPQAMEAVEMARASGDAGALAQALRFAHQVFLATDRLDQRRAICDEHVALGKDMGDRFVERLARWNRILDALESGDREQIDADLAALDWEEVVSGHSQGATLLLAEGRFAEARESADARVTALGSGLGVEAQAQLMVILWELGDFEAIGELLSGALAENPGLSAFQAGFSTLLAEQGFHDEAHEIVAAMLTDPDGASMPRDAAWVTGLCFLARCVAIVGRPDHAPALRRLLAPYSGTVPIAAQIVSIGSADKHLAELAALEGDDEAAEAWFHAAMDLERRLQLRPHLARTLSGYGRFLVARGRGDQAQSPLDEALAIARELGMRVLAAEIEATIDGA